MRIFASSGLSNPRLQTASGELAFPAKRAWWERGTGVPRKASGVILLRADCQIRVCKRQAGNWRSPREASGAILLRADCQIRVCKRQAGNWRFLPKRAAHFCFERIVKSASANGKRGTGVPRKARVVGAGNWRSPRSKLVRAGNWRSPRSECGESGELAFPAKQEGSRICFSSAGALRFWSWAECSLTKFRKHV